MGPLRTSSVRRDGEIIPQVQCPICEQWADVDGEQLQGAVSLICENCGWHGYINGESA